MATTGHQSPQSSLPPLKVKQLNTTTWGSGGTTTTITDTYISPNSFIDAYVTGSNPQAGNWSFTVTKGQVVITSTSSESSTLPITYIVL